MIKRCWRNAIIKGVVVTFDSARVRGLYTSLGDGWTYMCDHEFPQIPETVASAVARSFRHGHQMDVREYGSGTHAKNISLIGAQANGAAARRALADLTDTTPDAILLGPSLEVLYDRLTSALRPLFRRGGEVIACRTDDQQLGIGEMVFAESDLGTGEVPAWQYQDLVSGNTRLVSVSTAHRFVGTLHPIKEIGEIVAKQSRAWMLVDATPTVGFASVTHEDLDADIVAIDGLALGVPGIAALSLRDRSMFMRLEQEAFAPQDYAPSLAAGLGAAVDHLADLLEQSRGSRRRRLPASVAAAGDYVRHLSDYLVESLDNMPGVHVFGVSGEMARGAATPRAPRVSFCLPGVQSSLIGRRLHDNRLLCSLTPTDALLEAMGQDPADPVITVSLGVYNTSSDIDQLLRVVASFG
ncbi:aminotransferase class V-fold PLP-dependent enzyme [Corynebacterium sp. HS2168-gen11]|uniref:aminotransferase class V-fold PLP-dependent enzyme n=1 Tax=Corynebacterium sp. HS2168-gen11 TaxID=2974027 RepID=UPI00216B4EDA|nr:aminotransferase class V-fold PLP-dependent enzyme [Corynebacterium sp. HS2168-gen11]MCS4535551.1 aminotransferase class V-fold PLP-dependent enzyme [Corynebacterium sp. HS2168-gen11]